MIMSPVCTDLDKNGLNRNGISKSQKQTLKFLNHSKTVEPFPKISRSIFKKKGKEEITQLYYARNNIITEEMEFCAIRENEEEKTYWRKFKKEDLVTEIRQRANSIG